MSEMKLLMEGWRLFLKETRSQAFIDEFMPLLKQWNELQDEYGYIQTGRHDPEGNPYDPPGEGQDIDTSELPSYTTSKFYKHHLRGGPGPRRAHFAQSDREVAIERKLLQLFQKYADQSFFQNQVTLVHNLNYNAAASNMFGNTLGLEFPKPSETREGYLSGEGTRHRDVMSCHGFTDNRLNSAGYGMILKGHVVFASRSDLASQTLRTAHQDVKKAYKHSGIPKRTGPGRVQGNERTQALRQKIHQRKRERAIAAGETPAPELAQEDLNNMINQVILGPDDIEYSMIEEVLVDNWVIDGWYCHFNGGRPWPEHFWEKAYKIGIQKPIYSVGMSGEVLGEVNLEDYFGEGTEEEKSEDERQYQRDDLRHALGTME
ncbi:hypothetical protein CL614_10165 [archaeon]|nr:hypothetical protein [archaeon]|tara:strand:+ start:2497 stop:3621 length:1125 start_codon:yes stop_codon:yes gene_type:complete